MEHDNNVLFHDDITNISSQAGISLYERVCALINNADYNEKLLSSVRALACRQAFGEALCFSLDAGVSRDFANLMMRELQEYIDNYEPVEPNSIPPHKSV